ncbi:MAG: YigZ family protein [Anaerolineaceae bacterium]|nr:YigZ family protein [Anaerolineaceae bacterium]
MPKPYPIPAQETRCETRVSNSRFIATVAPAFSVEQARAFIERIRAEYPDASHHVPAFLIGFGASIIAHSSDAGEPSGTAGKPILAVLRGSGLGDVVMVITRYFGGTKLGTGGLVRAYSEAARAVLTALPRAVKRATHTVLIVTPYSFFERVRMLVSVHKGVIVEEVFAVDVTLTARFPVENFETFQHALAEASAGALSVAVIKTNPDTILPFDETFSLSE